LYKHGLETYSSTSLQAPILSGAIVRYVSITEVVGNIQLGSWVGLQWHEIHAKCLENRSLWSKVANGPRNHTHTHTTV